ncbi:NmrA family NAD(P)-binding protein [Deinococcus marmoris]|uniref:Isoflavone reductase n=1 Tax=Deinococcus marmoris TaxID=249408 RepID=A0A1U7P130_9DEIO|nr:NmrA family NAD(P)-binding protein [Deinococcus marmoris]OLV18872.1 Isoflavone reductase [Deinococcus marmoris]
MTSTIILAGAAGDLGTRIARALVARGASVRALIRPNTSAADRTHLTALGLTLAEADPANVDALAAAMQGASCVISALNGLYDVIVERQSVLLDAAVRAGVPRFIPSDYSEDFTKTTRGDNRNLDLRREFMGRADRASIGVTTILNGAFMDMLGNEMPIIQPRIHRVLYWVSADQPMDFTTKDDVAAYVAAAALDDTTPRILRIAGDTLSARELAGVMSEVTGEPYQTLHAGNLGVLGVMIGVAKRVAPQPGDPFPAWQGMQYMRDMFSGKGKLTALNNDRYPDLTWTSVREQLTQHRPD